MLVVFAATILAGSLGAVHFVIVHLLLGRPIDEASGRSGIPEPGDAEHEL